MDSNERFISQLNSVDKASFASEDERKRAVDAARSLVNRLEQPIETAFRLVWLHPTLMAMLRTASQLQLFQKWTAAADEPMTEEQLAALVSCERSLLSRLLQQLAANQILQYAEGGRYRMADFARSLAEPEITSCVNMFFDFQMPIFLELPAFLASNGYKNPIDPVKNVWVHSKGQDFMSFLQAHPPIYENLMVAMKASASFRGSLIRDYPAQEILASIKPDTPLLVDVGGSIGHDVSAFHQKYPQPPGQLFLQDLPNVLDMASDLDPAIKKAPLDFFKDQPVQGAAFYYMHSILHDWPDAECVKILDNVKKAMTPGRSKLLVHDVVVDSLRPSAEAIACDITMMGMTSGKERTDTDWKSLLTEAGFKVTRILTTPVAIGAVIEAEML